MANPLKGEASLGEYTLTLNFDAFCELEDRTGRKAQEMIEGFSAGLSFGELRDFVWAALQCHHAGISEDDLKALLREHEYAASNEAIGKALVEYFGEVGKVKGKNPRKAAA